MIENKNPKINDKTKLEISRKLALVPLHSKYHWIIKIKQILNNFHDSWNGIIIKIFEKLNRKINDTSKIP